MNFKNSQKNLRLLKKVYFLFSLFYMKKTIICTILVITLKLSSKVSSKHKKEVKFYFFKVLKLNKTQKLKI